MKFRCNMLLRNFCAKGFSETSVLTYWSTARCRKTENKNIDLILRENLIFYWSVKLIWNTVKTDVNIKRHISFNKTNKTHEFPKFYFVKKLYTFRPFPLPIIRSFLLYIRHWYISCRSDDSFQAGSGCSILTLLGSCHQTRKKYTNVECTIENSWWWANEMPETCRVFWQNKIWEIRASCWFY